MSSIVKIILLIMVIILIVFSAFFSSSEYIYSTVNKLRLKRASANSKKAKNALNFAEDYTNTLSTILVGNNLVNISISSIATLLAIDAFGSTNGPLFSTIISTIVVLIFGEIIPKTIGPKYSYKLSMSFSTLFRVFQIIFFPLVYVVNKFVKGISKLWTPKEEKEEVTEDELLTITDELEEDGFIDSEDAILIKSAIEFIDVDAYEIMIPRVDVFAIDINDDIDDLFKDEEIFRYSRVPIYDDDIDHIVGILNTTTLMKYKLAGKRIELKNIITEPMFVHKTKSASQILLDFKKESEHIAIVIDEFGGTMGILTLEDILEELVGDILDELDPLEKEYEILSDNEYLIDGDMNIYDFFDLINYDDRSFESNYSTVGGFCTEMLEKFPEVGDHFKFSNLEFTIKEAEVRRVEFVYVKVNPIEEE